MLQKVELFDCHVHPDYSLDASGTIDEYCQKALQIGLKGICFTSHFDIDPERKEIDAFMRVKGKITPLSQQTVEAYIEEIENAKSRYEPSGLKIKTGLEVDYSPHIEKQLREELSKLKLDYVLGAVHCLEHIAITSSEEAHFYFERKSAEKLCEEYYANLLSGIKSGLFNAVAHLDGFKKYALDYYGGKLLEAERKWIEPVLQEIKNNQIGIELNTGWFRKGKKRFFPDEDVLKKASESGVKIVALGSDSHRVEELGLGLQDAVDCIEKNNLQFEFFLT
ncbi:MAG: histidinol-phosphatase [candidate division Zixibacteria bacterium]|nr:histidinol-phosphatase [candidate division Zixibacteria bacterium]